jgi:hypothetical protein
MTKHKFKEEQDMKNDAEIYCHSDDDTFVWDYNEKVPFIEMMKFSRKHPKLHLYQVYDTGATFEVYIFSKNAATAKKKLYSSMYLDYPKNFLKLYKWL